MVGIVYPSDASIHLATATSTSIEKNLPNALMNRRLIVKIKSKSEDRKKIKIIINAQSDFDG